MGAFQGHAICPQCGKENLAIYDDGVYTCFTAGCNYVGREADSTPIKRPPKVTTLVEGGEYLDLKARGINKDVCEKFGIRCGLHFANMRVYICERYDKNGNVGGQQIKSVKKVNGRSLFDYRGSSTVKTFFGQQAFSPTSKYPIYITEGIFDAAAVYQLTKYSVVSLVNGAGRQTATEIKNNLEWLLKWKRVVLVFDNDDAGQVAREAAIEVLGAENVSVARLPLKDANEMLLAGRGNELKSILWNAQDMSDDSVISFDEITTDEIKELCITGADLPFPKLNEMLGGLRSKSLYTLVAREKAGKTSLTKEIALHLINQGYKVGLLYLEEDAVKEALSFVAMENNEPMWKMEEKLSDPDHLARYHNQLQAYKGSGLFIYNHKGLIDIPSVYSKMVYMVKSLGCEYIILDNLSISIAGNATETNERREIDKVVYNLVKLINGTGCTILTIVHLVKNRKDKDGNDIETICSSDVHGSGAFAKFSHGLIGVERRTGYNCVRLKVIRNRYKGFEGYADTLQYNTDTGRMTVTEGLGFDEEDDHENSQF